MVFNPLHPTDSEFVETFLLTFSSFMSPSELMDALIARYEGYAILLHDLY